MHHGTHWEPITYVAGWTGDSGYHGARDATPGSSSEERLTAKPYLKDCPLPSRQAGDLGGREAELRWLDPASEYSDLHQLRSLHEQILYLLVG